MSPPAGVEEKMRYTENFKKQVVGQILKNGVRNIDVSRKLHVSLSAIDDWRKLYAAELAPLIPVLDIGPLLVDEPVDVEELLRKAEYLDLKQSSGSDALAQKIDQIRRAKKEISQYTDDDKYAVVMSLRAIPAEAQGIWLRQLGIQNPHIRLWEDKLITMSKKPIDNEQYMKQLEAEVQRLKKNLAEAERDNRELKILIELKKKYHTLFQQDEEKS